MSFRRSPDTSSNNVDPELQRFVEVESQKARFHANVHQFTGISINLIMLLLILLPRSLLG